MDDATLHELEHLRDEMVPCSNLGESHASGRSSGQYAGTTIVPASNSRLTKVTDPLSSLRAAYEGILEPSDFICIATLVKQGKVDVKHDMDTHRVVLIPDPDCEAFMNAVFEG